MYAILKKEFSAFFSSPVGYAIVAVYLVINGLFLWVFEGDFNILHAGFADLNSYFFIAPWIFLFLIPAITMRSFSEEISNGTIEILKTKPIADFQIVLGKFLGAFVLVVFSLLPTLVYMYSVYQLGNPVGNIDIGTTLGSFVGLLFLSAAYTSIGIFSSVFSKNQVISFVLSLLICFFFFYGFEAISTYNVMGDFDYFIKKMGMYEHFTSIGKGVIDTRDLFYFVVITAFFLILTSYKIANRAKIKSDTMKLIAVCGVVLFLSSKIYQRFDVTKDKRYTLSLVSKETLSKINQNVFITVYLEGSFPSEFKRLQTETKQFLQELKSENSNVQYKFVDPKGMEEQLLKKGLMPSRLQIMQGGTFSELLIFPWAVVQYKNKTEIVSLLKDIKTHSQNQQLQSSIQNIEYAFVDALHKVSLKKSQKIAVLRGNGELPDIRMADFLKTLKKYYYLAPFTLDSVAKNPQKTLRQLSEFDAIIVAKPTQKFTEEEKYTLDQYICNGGKSLWLINQTTVSADSLSVSGETLAYPNDLGVTDLLFKYGVRINYDLITDLQCAKIPLATGNVGSNTQYNFFDWKYHPLLTSTENHPINVNIEQVHIQFANGLELLKNPIKKTILLQSSSFSKLKGTPSIVSLKNIHKLPKKEEFSAKNIPIAVLLEGSFESAYKGRVQPYSLKSIKTQSIDNKMVLVSDGNLIANEVKEGNPLPLGTDKWSGQKYGNKAFLLNAVNYLLGDEGLVHMRAKKIKVQFLNKKKAYEEAFKWQFINILFPLLLLAVFGLVYKYYRKLKYQ